MRTEHRTGKRTALLAGTIVISGALAEPALAVKWDITPALTGQVSYSDNIGLDPSGNQRSDVVFQITPRLGARTTEQGGRVKANFDLGMTSLTYGSQTSTDQVGSIENWFYVRAGANAELVENFLFLDARAYMNPQPVSSVGRFPSDIVNTTANRAQTAGLSISPSIRGKAFGEYDYSLSYGASISTADTSAVGDLGTGNWNGRFGRPQAFGPLGWDAYFSSSRQRYDNRSDTTSYRYGLTGYYRVDAQLRFSARVGSENNDYSGSSSTSFNYGAGVDWSPTPRTSLGASIDERYFGKGYDVRFSHRMSRSAFRFNASRDVTTTSQTQFDAVTIAILPPPFDELAASITDPAARQAFIQQLLNLGIASLGTAQQAFITDRLLIVSRIRGSYALRGVRNTLTVTFGRDVSESAVTGGGVTDDLTGASEITTRDLGIYLRHSLTPTTSLTGSATFYTSERDSIGSPDTKTQRYDLTLSSRLGAHTSGAVGLRHARSTATSGDYDENGVYGSLTYTF